MPVLDPVSSLAVIDGVACALLAAAASCRARALGANLAGAAVLGCLCALSAPAAREALLRGQDGAALALAGLPDEAAIGALGGLAALALCRTRPEKAFFWLDAASIGAAAPLCALLGAQELGLAGGLALGVACGLGPGLLRDAALGDSAMFVERDWYAAAAFTGCLVALAADALLFVGFGSARHLEWGWLAGALATVGLRRWKGYGFPA